MTTPRQRLTLAAQRRYLDFRLPEAVMAPLRALEAVLYGRRADAVPIDRPIFVVGCHRSGTTVLYEALAAHPDVACFTNASSLLPDAPILANRVLDAVGELQHPVERFAGDGLTLTHRTPSEGIRIFERFAPAGGAADYVLDETHSDPALERYLRATIRKHLRYFRARRFLNKNPDNSVRLRYLNRLFPDARFLHIVRDGRAVCASLLKFRAAAAAYFGSQHRHATSGVKVPDWPRIATVWDTDPVRSVGLLWRDVMAIVERDRQAIPADRFVEVLYEDFVADPQAHLRRIAERCDLRWDGPAQRRLSGPAARLALGERNEQWRRRFDAADLERLMPIIGPTLRRYGYAAAKAPPSTGHQEDPMGLATLNPQSLRTRAVLRMHQAYLTTDLPAPLEAPLSALEGALYGRDLDAVPIDRPIFVVGCHRSGTTVLYEALAAHPDVACFTNASNLLPQVPMLSNAFCRLLGLDSVRQERFLQDDISFTPTTPSEGIRIFERFAPAGGAADYVLDETHSDPALERYLRATIRKHLRYFRARRFLNKNPDNSVRLRYLNRLFPDARFLHIVRDGRAVCASLLKARELAQRFFGSQHRHATSGTKVKDWDEISRIWDEDPVAGAGHLWREVVATVTRDGAAIGPARFMEVRYEDFVARPEAALRTLARFCQLGQNAAADARLAAAAGTIALGSRNNAWKRRFSAAEQARLLDTIGPTMRACGYDV